MEPDHRHDCVEYPEFLTVPETLAHKNMRSMLMDNVRAWLAACGIRALTGGDQFLYWEAGPERRSISPDTYVKFGADPHREVGSWKVWSDGVPDVAIELVSTHKRKDHVDAPRKYGEVGVPELIVFDPAPTAGRPPWQVWRRRGEQLVLEASDAEMFGAGAWSKTLQVWLRAWIDPTSDQLRIRLFEDETAGSMVPLPVETERAEKLRERAEKLRERAEKLRERRAKQRALAEADQERVAREAAEAELAELKRQLDALRR